MGGKEGIVFFKEILNNSYVKWSIRCIQMFVHDKIFSFKVSGTYAFSLSHRRDCLQCVDMELYRITLATNMVHMMR